MFSREKLAASTKAITDRLGNEGYAFANANAVPNVDKEKRTVAFTHRRRSGPPRLRAAHQRRRQHQDARRGDPPRDAPARRRLLRRLEDPAVEAGASTAPSSSRRSTSRPRRSRAAPTRSTSVYTVEGEADRRAAARRWASPAWRRSWSRPRSRRRTSSAAASSSRPTSTAASVNQVYSLSYIDPYCTVDGVSRGFDVYKRNTDASSLAVGAVRHRLARRRRQVRLPGVRERLGQLRRSTSSRSSSRCSPTARCRTSTSSTRSAPSTPTARCSAGWARDTRDSLIPTTRRHLHARLERARRRRPRSTTVSATSTSGSTPLSRDHDAPCSAASSATPTASAASRCRSSRTSTPAARARCAATSSFSLGPQDGSATRSAATARSSAAPRCCSRCRARSRTSSLRLAAFIDGGQVYARTKIELGELRYRRRPRARLDLAVRPAAPVLRAAR